MRCTKLQSIKGSPRSLLSQVFLLAVNHPKPPFFLQYSSAKETPKPLSLTKTDQTPIGSSVIPLVNKLQDIFAPFNSLSEIKLPQVIVVGSQSSGKSSVLEALVGRDFLPRGTDICTRRPLVLQLENRARTADYHDEREWGEFLHLPGQRFFDFTAIRLEIQAETEKEAGTNKGVSDKTIRLKISSPSVLNITLVDLPGITKVPVGDQPNDIEARIRTMIMSYIKQETSIILAVTPANSDLATSDALQMAQMADPGGTRTIGVITKLDIMDRGTDACNFLLGKVVPLRLGYIGVVNRSQEDINHNRSIAEALAYEKNFFRSHPVYHDLYDRCGIPQLAKKLNLILEQHIGMLLPGLKDELKFQLEAVYKELKTYGQVIESKAEQGRMLLNIMTKYSEGFSSLVDGKNQEMSTKALIGGARINYIFQSTFVQKLEKVDPCDDLTDEEIKTVIQNANGPKSSLFMPEAPFEILIRKEIARLLHPSLDCLHLVHKELVKISRACEPIEMQRFPVLRRCLDEIVEEFLHDSMKLAEKMIEDLIEVEMDYINTSHPNFIGGSKAVEVAIEQIRSSEVLPSTLLKDGPDVDKFTTREKAQSFGAKIAKSVVNGVSAVANGVSTDQGIRPPTSTDQPVSSGSGRSWGIPSIFSGTKSHRQPVPRDTPIIRLGEPPALIKLSGVHTEHEVEEIIVTRLLLWSYYDIVRKNTQDFVPKAIMHFLVNHTKRKLLVTFIKKLYRENLFDEILQEHEEVATRRKHLGEKNQALQLAVQMLQGVEREVA